MQVHVGKTRTPKTGTLYRRRCRHALLRLSVDARGKSERSSLVSSKLVEVENSDGGYRSEEKVEADEDMTTG